VSNIFITKILIDRVRHLSGLTISLSENERKHLIITGKNGSGKTSLLEAVKNTIMSFPQRKKDTGVAVELRSMSSANDSKTIRADKNNTFFKFPDTGILVFIPAYRKLAIDIPRSIETVEIDKTFGISEDVSAKFLKYMVDLDYQKLSAKEDGNGERASYISKWFDNFEWILCDVYDCSELKLIKYAKEKAFKIVMPNREPFGLNEMADGYSALIKIVMELMMRMENKVSIVYDIPGIVLIDEIETHLHIDLQKKVLPFLTGMFPNIQFIVSTHSPFVISSISNTVVYDLENQQRLEDLSAYSYEGIVEYYFNADMYSDKIKNQFEQYKLLNAKDNRTPEENDELVEIIAYLKQIPPAAASEMIYSFRELERQRKNKTNG
jgi:predicted ATP-binding protein involved in virulence